MPMHFAGSYASVERAGITDARVAHRLPIRLIANRIDQDWYRERGGVNGLGFALCRCFRFRSH